MLKETWPRARLAQRGEVDILGTTCSGHFLGRYILFPHVIDLEEKYNFTLYTGMGDILGVKHRGVAMDGVF